MVSLVNSHANATSKRQHLWEIDLTFALNSTPGWLCLAWDPHSLHFAALHIRWTDRWLLASDRQRVRVEHPPIPQVFHPSRSQPFQSGSTLIDCNPFSKSPALPQLG